MLCESSNKLLTAKHNTVLILVLMEDALRELNLRRTDCQLVTVPFLENPLDFRGKSVPNCPQIYEFSRSPHEATIIQSDFIYASIKEFERCLGGDCGLSSEVRTNSSEVSFDSSEVSFDSSEVSFRLHVEDLHSPRRNRSISLIVRFVPTGVGFVSSWVRGWYLLLGRFVGAFPW